MAYGWGIYEPAIKPLEEGGDNINQYALKIQDALNALYVELRQDIVRATLAESIAATDIKKIITPSTAFRTYYGMGEPSDLQGKNNDVYIRYGDVKDTYIKVSGSWQKLDAIPQAATLDEVNTGLLTTKYVTPQTMNQNNKSDQPGGFPRLDWAGLLPVQYLPTRMTIFDTQGTYYWTCPYGVTQVLISGCAGGGGGGSDGDDTSFGSLLSLGGGKIGGSPSAGANGATISGLIPAGSGDYLSGTGSQTITAKRVGTGGSGPFGMGGHSGAYASGWGAGGAGSASGRGGSGAGGACINYRVNVAAGTTYTVIIGKAGTGTNAANGSPGFMMIQW